MPGRRVEELRTQGRRRRIVAVSSGDQDAPVGQQRSGVVPARRAHRARFGERVSGRIVDLGRARIKLRRGIGDLAAGEASGNEDAAITEQRRGVPYPDVQHLTDGVPFLVCRDVAIRAIGDRVRPAGKPSGQQRTAVGERRRRPSGDAPRRHVSNRRESRHGRIEQLCDHGTKRAHRRVEAAARQQEAAAHQRRDGGEQPRLGGEH